MSAPAIILRTIAPWLVPTKTKETNSNSGSAALNRADAKAPKQKKIKKKVTESASMHFNGKLKESLTDPSMGDQAVGKRFRVVLIQEGMGNLSDCFYYTASAITSCIPLFEGKKLFVDHADKIEEEIHPERSVKDVAGYFENISTEVGPDGRTQLVGDAVLLDSPDVLPIRARMMESIQYSKNHPDDDLVGLSINAGGDFDQTGLEQFLKDEKIPESCKPKLMEALNRGITEIFPVRQMTFANSCDLVTQAGAGGRITQVLEREKGKSMKKEGKAREEESKEDEAKSKEDGSANPAADNKVDGDGSDSSDGSDADGDDSDKDAELIQAMMKKYLGDGFTEEDHAMAKQMHQAALEACEGNEDEAQKMAGYNMKMARHVQAKMKQEEAMKQDEGMKQEEATKDGGSAPDVNQTPAPGPSPSKVPSKDQVGMQKQSAHGSSKAYIQVVAENAKLKAEFEALQVEQFIEASLKESKLPMAATKKFRECIKGTKSKKEVTEKLTVFREAYTAGSESDGMGFILSAEHPSAGSSGGVSFEDCKIDE